MQMEPEHKRRIKEIMAETKCDNDFKCHKSEFEKLCKARAIGNDSVIECSRENTGVCKFRASLGHSWFCTCPVRVYLGVKMGL
jgi:hypothetical protein